MEDTNLIAFLPARKRPWNKGRLTGQKPPLQPKHVWAIRTRLQLANRTRDLALFNLAIDSKLRGCDVVRLLAEEIAPNCVCVDRATIRQRKTGRPVRFEVTEQTRQSVLTHLKDKYLDQSPYLFPSRADPDRHLSTRQYARLVSGWVESIGLDAISVWHALAQADQGNLDLPANWQPAGRPVASWPHQDRKHGALSR
jgi:integrase